MKTPLQQHLTSFLGEDQESRNSWYEHRETLKESKGNEVVFENYILPVETGISLWEACWVGLAAYTVYNPMLSGICCQNNNHHCLLEPFFLNQ